jgi:hypothetical protein
LTATPAIPNSSTAPDLTELTSACRNSVTNRRQPREENCDKRAFAECWGDVNEHVVGLCQWALGKNLHVIGLSVGSRRMFESMAAAIDRNRLKPVVDRRFAFNAAPEALRLMQAGRHFGNIVVEFPLKS